MPAASMERISIGILNKKVQHFLIEDVIGERAKRARLILVMFMETRDIYSASSFESKYLYSNW